MNSTLHAHIERLLAERPGPGEALKAYAGLAPFLEGAADGVAIDLPDPSLDAVKLREGFPLLSPKDLPLPLDRAAALLGRILDHLSRSGRPDAEGLKQAVKRFHANEAWARGLFEAVLSEDPARFERAARDVDLDPQGLEFLARVALRPFMERLREAAADRMPGEAWGRGTCPLCGSLPDMACLVESGKRRLHCSLCGMEWPYPRLRCPFCATDDHERLGYLTVEGEEGARVDVCEACRRYLKTVDRRVLETAAPLDLEHLATLHLDLIAAERGYR